MNTPAKRPWIAPAPMEWLPRWPKSPEQIIANAERRKAKLHAAAVIAGRDPTLVGRPPRVSAEEKHTKVLARQKRVRAERREARLAAGILPKPPGPAPLPTEERARRRLATFRKFRETHRDRRRPYEAEWWRNKRAAKALAEGRVPGTIGHLSTFTAEEQAAYLALWRGDDRKFIFQIKAQNSRCRRKGIPGEITVADLLAIFAEQRGCCAFCGTPFDEAVPEIDHWKPLVKGGTNERHNVRLLHKRCNRTKGGRHPAGTA